MPTTSLGRLGAAALGSVVLLVTAALPVTAVADKGSTAGTLTPAMHAEIERVVAEGRRMSMPARASARELATAGTRCATFEGERYCLGLGWTNLTQDQAAARLARRGSNTATETTGDLAPAADLRRRARMSPDARADAERRELTEAAVAVDKVLRLRAEIQGTTAARTVASDYPERTTILHRRKVRAQNRYYFCGPATMQMIAWGWSGNRKPQNSWAKKLGTTSAGTSIVDMVRMVNRATGYDNDEHAGDYIALDISDFSFEQWWLLMMRHVHDYQAPVVLHPVLLKQYFPYLDDDASGHFQVGRGFDQNPDGPPLLSYFEPWDQSRFDPTEPRIRRTQWQSAYKSYRANQAHFQHNVGV
ncbi:C39 family peptidase [Nocardioides piscis]|uniref:Peptidase C39-like domain-containing protein n=1 Tax=Nocardioides piscis TaxID=2714938 RepID=A0A6G7YE71_9ACTN|nr:C39 family peptidase [Nocardioides piscis]QIK75093.1 hypothetical protein G7071_06270 [Nocardioides piscis]